MHTSHFQSPWREHHTEPFPSFVPVTLGVVVVLCPVVVVLCLPVTLGVVVVLCPVVVVLCPEQPVKSFCCKLDSCVPWKSLQVICIPILCFSLSHLQNGMFSQSPQSILKRSCCSFCRFTNAFPLTNDIVLFIRDRPANDGRLLKSFSSIFDMSLLFKLRTANFDRLLKAFSSIFDMSLLFKDRPVNDGRLLKSFSSIFDMSLLFKLRTANFGRLLKAFSSIFDMSLLFKDL